MSDLSVGSTFAGCRLDAVAGRGGMGVVYRATQVALGRPVALKAIAPWLAGDAGYRERFKRESQIAASIDHPNVIPVYEAGELDGTLYLIMRWVEGTDLRARLADRGPLEPAAALSTLRPVASALGAAHRRGLVHRDVKPANVLLSDSEGEEHEHPYLTDFGIARRIDGGGTMTRSGVLIGTLDYTAPERIDGGPGTPASDIYAFGCMFYESLTGEVPFARPTELAKMHAHLNEPVPAIRDRLPQVPARLDDIIATATAKDPAARFGSAVELAGALERALDEVTTAPIVFGERLERAELPTDETEIEAASHAVATENAFPSDAGAPPADGTLRRSRRRVIVVVCTVLVLVVVAVVAVVGSGSGGTPAAQPKIAQAIDLRAAVRGIAADPSGAVWLSLPVKGQLLLVSRDGIEERYAVPNAGLVAAGPAGVWVTDPRTRSVALYSPAGRLLERVALPGIAASITADPDSGVAWVAGAAGPITPVGAGSTAHATTLAPGALDLGFSDGALWAANGSLIRIDPVDGKQVMVDAGPGATALTFDRGIWTANTNGTATRFDPRDGRENAVVQVSSAPLTAIAAIENSPFLWAISPATDSLHEISAAEKRVTATITFKATPTGLAVTPDGSVWVTTSAGELERVT